MTTPSPASRTLRLFPLPHEPGLSLVHIEYLYSMWRGSRSLISKVTCWASAGSAAATGLAWDAVTWDILSPRRVLVSLWGRGLCFLVSCLWLNRYKGKKQNKQNAGKNVFEQNLHRCCIFPFQYENTRRNACKTKNQGCEDVMMTRGWRCAPDSEEVGAERVRRVICVRGSSEC